MSRIRILVAAVVLTMAATLPGVPAQARTAEACERQAGEWESGLFCLEADWRVNRRGRVVIEDARLTMTSSRSDDRLGYQGMHNIDLRVSRVVPGEWVHVHNNGATDGRLWRDSHRPVRTGSGYVRVTVDYTIAWTSLFGWSDTRDRLVLYLRRSA